jgi:hypothetical protein
LRAKALRAANESRVQPIRMMPIRSAVLWFFVVHDKIHKRGSMTLSADFELGLKHNVR